MSASADKRLASLSAQLGMQPVAASSKPRVSIAGKSNGVAVILISNPPVNSLHPEVQAGIGSCYKQCCDDPEVKAVVITGGKTPFFMAGADIDNVHKLQLGGKLTPDLLAPGIAEGMKIFNTLESGPKPTVAAVNGQALGGGCELAMACNARVAVPFAAFGQPELKLGIIPGLGGCNRFPRLIGLKTAIETTVAGKTIKAKQALDLGLVDAIVKPEELIFAAGKLALDIASGKKPRRKSLYENAKIGTYAEGKAIIDGARALAKKKNPHVPHFDAYFNCVEEGLKNGGEAGLKREEQEIAKLIPTISAKSLMHFFFASRATSKVKGIPAKPSGKPIKRVAVIGAGTMGAGIAIIFLMNGYEVVLKEVNQKFLEAGVARILDQVIRVLKSRKLPSIGAEFVLRNLIPTTTYDEFAKCDLVIEAALENLELKQKIFAELEKVCPPTCILATNTSTIDIEKIAAKTKAQDRIIGLHYFSPAHIMPLLEIIRTPHTSPEAVSQALLVSKKTKKIPVVVGNCVGFTANRIFFPYGQAAFLLVVAGLSPYQVDKAIERFGMPMGPFRMTDLSGLDIGVHAGGVICNAYPDRVYKATVAQQLVDAGRLGQKTGKGIYKYEKGKPVPDEEGLEPFLSKARAAAKIGFDVKKLSEKDIVEIIFFPVVNESLRVLEEGFASSMSDIDIVSCLGYGYPTWRGGILFWAEHGAGGWQYIKQRLEQFSSEFGASTPALKAFFAPSDYLNKLAAGKQ